MTARSLHCNALDITNHNALHGASTALATTPDRQITVAALTNSFVITEKTADVKSMKSMKITFMEALKQLP